MCDVKLVLARFTAYRLSESYRGHEARRHLVIRVGLTERHGISDEYAAAPPPGVSYAFVRASASAGSMGLSSSARGIFDRYDDIDVDILEAPLFPILTKQPWIYTPAEYSGSANFGFLGLPLPRGFRLSLLERYFSRPNLKKILFKSHAGLETLKSYGRCSNELLLAKAEVVYPAVQRRRSDPPPHDSRKNLLFSGDFFRKGGASVVEAFEDLQQRFPDIRLRLCCDEDLAKTRHPWAEQYHRRVSQNPAISIGRVPRKVMIEEVLPATGIFVSPTVKETFGFAILEAMAFGIPVVTSDVFAIPEIISDGSDGFMVPIRDRDFVQRIRGYGVNAIPDKDFDEINAELVEVISRLLVDDALYERVGNGALAKVAARFSPTLRAEKMLPIYRDACEPA
jgi:glycosyltransferase involved in cell wall biosynthesis